MGLDVTAYNNIEIVKFAPTWLEEYEDVPGMDEGYINPHFPHAVTVEVDKDAECVYFEDTKLTERFHFRAGSYSGYSQFRSSLCTEFTDRQVWDNPEKYSNIPFAEIINFSDCEGVFLGNDICEKLYNDFSYNYETYVESTEDDWMIRVYEDFIKAFGMARNDGIVIFR